MKVAHDLFKVYKSRDGELFRGERPADEIMRKVSEVGTRP